jgi:hypothetical protein
MLLLHCTLPTQAVLNPCKALGCMQRTQEKAYSCNMRV